MEKIVILGQPKSGTTATYYKIEHSLEGKSVSGLFEPKNYNGTTDSDAQYLLAKVLLNHFSEVDYSKFLYFDKIIYIVRDPRDWLISHILFQMRAPRVAEQEEALPAIMEMLQQKEADPKSISLLSLMNKFTKFSRYNNVLEFVAFINNQLRWVSDFERNLGNAHLLKYEDFVDEKLEGLENFLNFKLHDGDAQPPEYHSHTVRTTSYGNWRNWFLESDVEFFQPLFKTYMEKHGYENDWTLNEKPHIDPKVCSEYVARNMGWEKRV